MASMDIFNEDAFSVMSMAGNVDRLGYLPNLLGSIPGLFEPVPVTSDKVWIESRSAAAPALILTTPRGSPPRRKGAEVRQARGWQSTRIALADRVTAEQVAGIRAFGTESELQRVQSEISRRQTLLRRDVELTQENMRLGAVQGIVTDADSSVLWNWATEWGVALPTEIDFDLDNGTPAPGAVRLKAAEVIRGMTDVLSPVVGVPPTLQIYALTGNAFYDALITHPEVEKTYLNWVAAQELRGPLPVYSQFTYGGITWLNYRGAGSVAVNTDKAKFFPANAGIFKWVQSPAETFDFVNTPGQDVYSWIVTDKDRNAWADVEMYSYPLPVVTVPDALYSGRRT